MPLVVQGLPVHGAKLSVEPPTSANEELMCQAMEGLGFPIGLAKQLIASTLEFPIRIWVVDNSGSMNTGDGKCIVKKGDGRLTSMKTSRWAELSNTIVGIAELATTLDARTDFHLLNATGQGQYFSVGGNNNTSSAMTRSAKPLNLSEFKQRVDKISPSGGTPLTQAIEQIISLLKPAAPKLHATGQKACVVVATDGLPDNESSFLGAMYRLQRLPIHLVVRLCTDDHRVVSYYNELDRHLEVEMEVLDDVFGEAEQVYAYNAWLRYGPSLHRAREFGLHNKVFDLLDEQTLVPNQVKRCCEAILGCSELPEPEVDPMAFKMAIKESLRDVAPVFDPVSKSMRPWVDTKKCGPRSFAQNVNDRLGPWVQRAKQTIRGTGVTFTGWLNIFNVWALWTVCMGLYFIASDKTYPGVFLLALTSWVCIIPRGSSMCPEGFNRYD